MKRPLCLLFVLMIMISACGEQVHDKESSQVETATSAEVKLSDLTIPAEAAGAAWVANRESVFDEFGNFEGMSEAEIMAAKSSQQYFARYGVVAMGNIYYDREGEPGNRYIIQAYLFDTVQSLNVWWKWRFVDLPHGEFWQVNDQDGVPVADHSQSKKRALRMGRMILLAQNSQGSDHHYELLAQYQNKAKRVLPPSVLKDDPAGATADDSAEKQQ